MKINKQESDMLVPQVFLGEMYFRGTPNMDSYFTDGGLTRLNLDYNYLDYLDKIECTYKNDGVSNITSLSKRMPVIFKNTTYNEGSFIHGNIDSNLSKNKILIEGYIDFASFPGEVENISITQQFNNIKKSNYSYSPVVFDITRRLTNEAKIRYIENVYDYSNSKVTVSLTEIATLLEMYKNGKNIKNNLDYLKTISDILKKINNEYYEFIKEYKTLKLK